MTMNEKRAESLKKEIEKYTKSLERAMNLYKKADETCKSLGCDWSQAEMRAASDAGTMSDKQWSAWFKRVGYEGQVEDWRHHIATAERNLAKVAPKAEADAEKSAEDARIENLGTNCWRILTAEEEEQRKAKYEAWLKEFKAECLEDGIVIEEACKVTVSGTTKAGRRFAMWANNGVDVRSRHCYTLYINGECVFTSGDFTTGYQYLLKH